MLWLILSSYRKKVLGWIPGLTSGFLCTELACCMCGFPLGTRVSSHSLKTCGLGQPDILNCPQV